MKSPRLFLIILISCAAVSLIGCRHEESNPELLDPIYLDLRKDLQDKTAERDALLKKIVDSKKDLAASAPRTIDRLNAETELHKEKSLLLKLNQEIAYAKIRAERRRVEGRRAYKIAFLKGENWPDPKEYKEYLLNKQLLQVAGDWNRPPKHPYKKPSGSGQETPGEQVKDGHKPE